MAEQVTKQLHRKLGFFSVFSICIGASLAPGVFILPGLAAGQVGPWVGISYVLSGLLVLPALLAKAELATAMPVSGGTYVYIDRAMGPLTGTIVGLGTWLSLAAKTAFALVGLGAYLMLFADFSESTLDYVAVGILLVLLAINILGAGKASALQTVIVMICLAALAWFSIEGTSYVEPKLLEPAFPFGLTSILSGAGFLFVSYAGITKVCSVAEEVKNPGRNIPLGMISAQITLIVLYAVTSYVITGNVSYSDLAHDYTPVATAAESFGGTMAKSIMAGVAILALASMCNAGIMASSRFPFAMGRDRIFPESFGWIHPRFNTPLPALLLTGCLLILLVTYLPIVKLAKLASGMKIFIFTIVNLALIILRETHAPWYKPTFRVPLYPWTPIIGILGGVFLIFYLGLIALAAVTLSILVGATWYFVYAKARVTRTSAFSNLFVETKILEATERAEQEYLLQKETPRVVVPVFGGEPAPERLVWLSGAFLDEGMLDVLRLEEIPDQASLSTFMEPDTEVVELAEYAEKAADQLHLDETFHDLLTHDAKEAVHHHVEQTNTRWIVMEWPSRNELHYLVRNPFAWWVEHAPCNVALFIDHGGRFDGNPRDDFEKILVIVSPGTHNSLLVDVARRVAADQIDAQVTLCTTVSPNTSEEELESIQKDHQSLAQPHKMTWDSKLIPTKTPIKDIAKLSRKFDLIVVDTSDRSMLRRMLGLSIQRRIAQAAICSVLQIKEHLPPKEEST